FVGLMIAASLVLGKPISLCALARDRPHVLRNSRGRPDGASSRTIALSNQATSGANAAVLPVTNRCAHPLPLYRSVPTDTVLGIALVPSWRFGEDCRAYQRGHRCAESDRTRSPKSISPAAIRVLSRPATAM